MVKQVANKKYCSPEVSLKLFINEDVITSSVGDDNIGGIPKKEHAIVMNARQQSNEASQPTSEGVVNTKR